MARLFLLLDLLELARIEDNNRMRQRRQALRKIPRQISSEVEFIQQYRLTPELFEELCTVLVPLLSRPRRSDAIAPSKKILTALSFFASGSYQTLVGRATDSSMAQPTVSCVVREVTDALNTPGVLEMFIKYPQNRQERDEIKHGFYRKFGMPGVVGCIDCTHVALVRPTHNEERYFNRRWYHSRNAQMICDSNMRIINVDASYGGCSHDSFIFNNCEIKPDLEQISLDGESAWLLGDAGYPQRSYLMTPIENAAEGSPEALYTRIQKSARNTIERTFGVLKGRWRCLLAARALHYDPLTVGKIINACCVLHNLCIAKHVPAPRLTRQEREHEQDLQRRSNVVVWRVGGPRNELQVGRDTRAQLVDHLRRRQ